MFLIHPAALRRGFARFGRDRRGVALLEFAFVSPVVLILGLYGIETSHLVLSRLRVSQVAANLADNISRTGDMNSLGVKTIREADINDAFAAMHRQSDSFGLTTYGRVILSSLERNASGGQWIHWQRCTGKKQWPSSYGVAGDGATGTALAGMGPAGQQIQAPDKSGVMFVEIAYDYQPIISNAFLGPQLIKSKAAFVIRDQRVFTPDASNPSNPAPVVADASIAKCTVFAA